MRLAAGAPYANEVVWLRPNEIAGCKQPVLFADGVEPGDVIQGTLSDCWILSALSMCATAEGLIENLFEDLDHEKNARYSKIGMYVCRFYKNGQWLKVIVDDRIPCWAEDNTPVFARCKDANEIWVLLVEKAYAKLHGCYEALGGGEIDYGLRDLTGMPCLLRQVSVFYYSWCCRWCPT